MQKDASSESQEHKNFTIYRNSDQTLTAVFERQAPVYAVVRSHNVSDGSSKFVEATRTEDPFTEDGLKNHIEKLTSEGQDVALYTRALTAMQRSISNSLVPGVDMI